MSQRRLAVILFADIAGYTARMQQDESLAKSHLQAFREAMQSQVPAHQGKIVHFYGDGCLALFDLPQDAAQAGIAIQAIFQEREVPVRIGLHSGTVNIDEDHVYGDAVNVASRVESMSVPGAVLLSKKVRDELKNQPSFELKSLGKFAFKNVEEPMELFALANTGLSVPRSGDLKGKGERLNTPKNQDAKRLVRGMLIGFVGLLAGVGIWMGISWDSKASVPQTKPSVAVMPFLDMSADQNQAYMGDGIAEELINLLSRSPNLKVSSRSSAFSLRDQKLDLPSIGKKLGVKHILEGSIRDNGEMVKISVQLIEAESEQSIWSNSWERTLEDVFQIQVQIANEVAQAMKMSLVEVPSFQVETTDPDAYRLFLQANQLVSQSQMKEARIKVLQSIALDSLYGPAWTILSEIDGHYAGLGWSPTGLRDYPSLFALAIKHARKGVALSPNSAKAYLALGALYARGLDANSDSAVVMYEKARAISPGDAKVLANLGFHKCQQGEIKEGLPMLERALALDPLSAYLHNGHGMANMLYAKNYRQAERSFRRALELAPQAVFLHQGLAFSLFEQGRLEEAQAVIAKEPSFGLRVGL
ncbi:MAG: adenylate/guanylate cyclase domain-containing protein [Bacteroidota bacterium]